ncbi:tRNA (guanosine(37)-N1)-methyltransferase TrmD [Limisalsivibrio acetivorans]|uniref:tRNA (guanosine(37)-N1)-methyltransferase TrmD n=1 Tax=Limisalsivibrio acetivorans TaxID=1304888 RepID=UPI0003B5AB7C|nr:tRNA (guanosine(37)-N1)-methyltransferase TrmD [Limisalsivibrio acetivorans]
MKKFNVLTIFPKMIEDHFSLGVVSKAAEKGILSINAVDVREYTTDKHRKTDEYQYGGSQGLVMKAEPIVEAVRDIKKKEPSTRVIVMDPRGKPFSQREAERLLEYDSLTFICGRYEGIDERVYELVADECISMGDFVLTGGELGAMTVLDSVARLIPGVLGDENSPIEESFSEGLLEYPHYTRPYEYEGLTVPEVLTNGHHAEIDKWRRTRSLQTTAERRPDLLAKAELNDQDKSILRDLGLDKTRRRRLYVALLHYPMRDKEKDVVATSITNMDLHDISRSCTTFGVKKYFVVTPLEAQRKIAERVMEHWLKGYGATYNVNRKEAFEGTELRESLMETIEEIERAEGRKPRIIATTARTDRADITYPELAEASLSEPHLLIFGTGWGFTDDVFDMADHILEPIDGAGDFNHLSVRSAVAIILDRLNRYTTGGLL